MSLQWRLSWWLTVAMLLVAALAAAVSYLSALDEANEMQDQTLRQIGALYGAGRLQAADGVIQFVGDDEAPVMILGLRRDATAVTAGALTMLPDGMHLATMNGAACRVLLRTVSPGVRLAVGQAVACRDEIANHSALRTLLPLLLLVPLLPLLVALLVRRLFLPVAALAREADRRSERELQALAPDFLPLELRPFVVAINRLLARVEKSMQQQRRFVADAAHELRSPLTALSLQAEALVSTTLAPPAQGRVAALRLGIERSRVLLDQMLALARAQTVLQRKSESVAVLSIFRRVLEDLMPLAEARQIDIGVESAGDFCLTGDPVDLLTLVKNLADNAIRYSPAGGKVDLCARAEAGQVIIEIIDRGPGIAPEQRERVFDPFFRVLGSEQSGSGLGLSIVAEIARRFGAAVHLDWTDAAQRQGLRVSVHFPA